jgi:hypothetical protein
MDKGMKGLLTGDLSVYIIQQIHTSIEMYKGQIELASKEIEDLLQEEKSFESYINENFSIGYAQDAKVPSYESYQNFQSYLLMMEKGDWKKNTRLQETKDYSRAPQQQANLSKFVDADMLT